MVLKFIQNRLFLAVCFFVLCVVVVAAAKPAVSKQFHKSVRCDTAQLVLPDSVMVITTTVINVIDTYRDTVKLIKSDSGISVRRDTVRAKRK